MCAIARGAEAPANKIPSVGCCIKWKVAYLLMTAMPLPRPEDDFTSWRPSRLQATMPSWRGKNPVSDTPLVSGWSRLALGS